MKKKRITPESQKTRLPFATVILFVLIGVILLGCVHSLGYAIIYGIGKADVLLQEIEAARMLYGDATEGVGYITGYVIGFTLPTVVIGVSFLLSDAIPLILCALCLVMVLLIIFKKRNVALFIPTAGMSAILTSSAIIGGFFVGLYFLLMTALSLLTAAFTLQEQYLLLDYLPSELPTSLITRLLINLYNCVVNTLYSWFGSLSIASLALAFAALALLFLSCGKGFIGIFKRAKKPCFVIFCIVIVLCALGIVADIAYGVFWNIQSIIQNLVNYQTTMTNWQSVPNYNLLFSFTELSLIIDYIVLPIYNLFDTRIVMNVLLLLSAFFIGLWIYSPHKKVREKKKKKVDLVDYVELDHSDDATNTAEAVGEGTELVGEVTEPIGEGEIQPDADAQAPQIQVNE